MSDRVQFLTAVLKDATDLAVGYFGHVEETTKPSDSNQVLTEADLAIGQSLVHAVQREFPGHNIIDEEAGVIDNGSDLTWVIDPIDGTSNFAAGTPHYGLMIGLLDHGRPVLGGVSLPAFGVVYTAETGAGCFRNGVAHRLPDTQPLGDSLLAYGIDGHRDDPARTRNEAADLAEIILSCRNLRSSNSVYDFCMVLEGRYGGWLNRTSKIWDNVAQECLMIEAGGVYTDYFGRAISYDRPLARVDDNFTVCAADPERHASLQALIDG